MAAIPTPFDSDAFLKNLTSLPGVYRMLDAKGQVLYVGKARNLKRRVSSYFRNRTSAKIHSLIEHTCSIEVTVTHTETEALLLESNLIKKLKPRYNVLLRDDKGYPYIHLSGGDFPRLTFQRGAKPNSGHHFGPYPSAGAVRETLTLLQKIFRLRPCEDSFFQHRRRPCLQHQIKRCSAPCTGLIDQPSYQQDVRHAMLFLEGKSGEVIDELVQRMETASTHLKFEAAASYRDQIAQLRKIQERQYVSGKRGDLDVIACRVKENTACVQVFFFRDGRLLGNRHFFPTIPAETSLSQLLSAFLTQYYLDRPIPNEIIVNHPLEEVTLLTEWLCERARHRVSLSSNVRGERARWLAMAEDNAHHALQAQLAGQTAMRRRFESLQDALGLDFEPTRLECFDVSHTQGEATVASCVVFNDQGPVKSDYRRYNISDVSAGDDYAAMRQALNRRYTRLRTEDGKVPDILFVDGGKGQVGQARQVLEELQLVDVTLIGIAKGADRKAGLEVLYLSEKNRPIILAKDSPALHLIQQIRDEAHRFAITGHRQRRAKIRSTSILEHIPGVGHKRRRSLLKQFGGLKQLARAGVEDIARVEGISLALAQRIYNRFHSED